MLKCKHCNQQVANGARHHCREMQVAGVSERTVSDDGNFFLSMIVAQATDSALLGYAVGGSLAGAFVGDSLNSGDSSSSSDSSSGSDYSGGSDSGGGSSGGD